jgi:hypothetical protein
MTLTLLALAISPRDLTNRVCRDEVWTPRQIRPRFNDLGGGGTLGRGVDMVYPRTFYTERIADTLSGYNHRVVRAEERAMANPEHVEVVKQGVLAIRRWRDANLN